jgi:hypothetical protein
VGSPLDGKVQQMKKNLRAIQCKNFDGAGTNVSIEELKKHLRDSERIELFKDLNLLSKTLEQTT